MKALWAAREDDGLGIELKAVDRPTKALQDPATDETCSAGDEKPFATQIAPKIARVIQNMIEVASQQVIHGERPYRIRARISHAAMRDAV